jgi:hypothetical protein
MQNAVDWSVEMKTCSASARAVRLFTCWRLNDGSQRVFEGIA